MSAPLSRRDERLNAWLSALLLGLILVVGNMLARRHLVVRWDLSEDQLFAVSDATKDTLGRMEARMQVKAYFTGDIKSANELSRWCKATAPLSGSAGTRHAPYIEEFVSQTWDLQEAGWSRYDTLSVTFDLPTDRGSREGGGGARGHAEGAPIQRTSRVR